MGLRSVIMDRRGGFRLSLVSQVCLQACIGRRRWESSAAGVGARERRPTAWDEPAIRGFYSFAFFSNSRSSSNKFLSVLPLLRACFPLGGVVYAFWRLRLLSTSHICFSGRFRFYRRGVQGEDGRERLSPARFSSRRGGFVSGMFPRNLPALFLFSYGPRLALDFLVTINPTLPRPFLSC
ncbi:hypothetical protein LZ32DRAFT_224769 [Colletotrichum eremochloae]|nr:hypothetical protein LZ32DRAFT_224769 [Colletotrichum eremochloae]